MSYSTNDKFYIDTDTSIARFEGNLDLLNNIRFGKTDTENGITFQANIINTRITENLTSLRNINNYTNSNNLVLDIEGIYTSNEHVNLILSARNMGEPYMGPSYTINTSTNTSFVIPNRHKLIIRSSISYPDNTYINYLPLSGTRANHLDYYNSYSTDYFAGYVDGTISSSNNVYLDDELSGFVVVKNVGYLLKLNTDNNSLEYSNFLFADESYYSGIINNDEVDISIGIYKNVNSTTSFKQYSQDNCYTPNPSLPATLNSYYIFILGHDIYDGTISFLKYYKTQDTILQQTLPKVLLVENKNFISYFLTKTNNVSIPIFKYQTDASPAGYSFVEENSTYSINGTSLGNTYQYVIHKLNEFCIPIWKIRIVFTNININLTDAIHIIYHSIDNSITASIINNQLTNVIIYSANNTSTILQNVYNVILHFNSSGQFQWSIKKDVASLYHKNKNSLIAYDKSTLFVHYLYDVQNKEFINVFNADGTTQNIIYRENNQVIAIDAIIYYNLNGKAQHDNYHQYSIVGSNNTSNLNYSYMSVNINGSFSNDLYYSSINKNISSNIRISYTDGFSDTNTNIQNANTVYTYPLIFNSNETGQKQLSIGNSINITKFNTNQMRITGNTIIEQDLTVNTINVLEDILLSSNSKLGIRKTPSEALDIIGNTIISGNIGIGTDIQKAKLNIDALNANAMNINNITLENYPPDFYNYGYNLTSSRIPTIDNKYDVKAFPPADGANYGAGTYSYLASSTGSFTIPNSAFDKYYTGTTWISANSKYTAISGFPITTGPTQTVVSSITYNGEWVQIRLPKKLRMIYYHIYKSIYNNAYFPKSWIIAGSDDGSTWTLVDSRTNQSMPSTYTQYAVNSAIQYQYYRMIITSIVGGGGATATEVAEWELFLNNVNTVNYDGFEVKTLNYKAKANTIYNYYYNDSNLYLPINVLDSTTTDKIWRTSNIYSRFYDLPYTPLAYLEIDIINPIPLSYYTIKGKDLLTYPSKWFLERHTGSGWTLIDFRDINNTTLTQLTNTYQIANVNFSASNYRFGFYRNFSSTSNYIEIATITFNKANSLNVLNINSNNDITFRGNVDIVGDIYDTGVTRPALKITSNAYNNALEVNGNTTIRSDNDTILTVRTTNNANKAEVAIYGPSHGTGRVFVGQSLTYGGGIEFNGDDSPITSGAGADYITLYRRYNSVDSWTARNYYNTNDWEFRGSIISSNPRFYAYGASGTSGTSGQYWIFPNVEVNIGGHYNATTGIFTVPIAGTYIFIWGNIGNQTNTTYRYYIYKNNNRIRDVHLRIDTASTSTTDYGDGERSYMTTLAVNDTMRIYYTSDSGVASYTSVDYPYFMGYLIG